MNASPTTALGVFDDHQEAVAAIEALKRAGFKDQQIGVASREFSKHFEGMSAHNQEVAETGAVDGAAIGTGIGAFLGLVGASLIPGVIPVVAGSVLMTTLIGSATGAALGAFAGPFIALGFSEAEAHEHARHVEEGKTVVLVYDQDRREEAQSIMVENGAYDDSMSTSP